MERFFGMFVTDGLVGFLQVEDEAEHGAFRLVAHLLDRLVRQVSILTSGQIENGQVCQSRSKNKGLSFVNATRGPPGEE